MKLHDDWNRYEAWTRRFSDFTVEVKHRIGARRSGGGYFNDNGGHDWFVYAYLYPNHPRFADFKLDGTMNQSAVGDFPLHYGCTFFQAHRDGERVASIQVGADYNHLHDEHFSFIESAEDAVEVFGDAERLIEFLNRRVPLEEIDPAALAAEQT